MSGIVERLRVSTWSGNVTDDLTRWSSERDEAADIITDLLAALEAICKNSYVGKAGAGVPLKSKWANYPAHLYHDAKAAIAKAKGGAA